VAVRLTHGRSYWRSVPRLPPDVRRALQATVLAMEAEASLPGADDVRTVIPPSLPAWRRRVGASGWWLYFELRHDGSAVLGAVAILP